MTEIKLSNYYVSARKDILHFVEEQLNSKVLEKIGKNPGRWIEELNIINCILTGDGLVAGIDIHQPPEKDPEFRKLGDNVFLYRGKTLQLCGLWISKQIERYDLEQKKEVPHTQWTHYRMGSSGTLHLNSTLEGKIDIQNFLPENFVPKSETVKDNKRPILTFNIVVDSNEITVYAKGTELVISYLTSPPSYRLTKLATVQKQGSKQEMEKTLELAENNVNVPKVLGYYEDAIEEYLFLQKTDGENPINFLSTHRKDLIEQDAQMLATLCLLGYKKAGFTDFDDKLFDGEKLFLIDVDELGNIYFPFLKQDDFRKILLDSSSKELRKFRREQRSLFKTLLKDVLFEYDSSLTPNLEDKISYIEGFYKGLGWKKPTEREIKHYTGFSKNYITLERSVSMMMEE